MKLEIKFLNSVRFTKLLIAASRWLSKYSDVLNDLNVYPVPDGDTGTNMSMTLQSVENELIKLGHRIEMDELVDLVSESILVGARGNSGMILSQFIQGFLSVLREKKEITIDDVTKAFVAARKRVYETVSSPVEGSMLTVISKVAEGAVNYKGPKDDFILFLVHVKNIAQEAVEETPNQLPQLKNAGVVDAGGKGIFYMLEGFEKSVTDPEMLKDLERIVKSQEGRKKRLESPNVNNLENRIRYNYSLEFVVENENLDLDKFKEETATYGEIVVCAKFNKKTKLCINTDTPGIVLDLGIKHGQLTNIKIENIFITQETIETEAELDNEFSDKIENYQKELSFEESSEVIYGIDFKNRENKISDVAIVTDSASDLTKEFIKGLDVSIIPLNVKLGSNEYYKDGSEMIKNSFWQEITKNNILPNTSQPSPGEFKKLYEDLLKKGYKKIISIHISSKLSGTQQAAKVAKEMLDTKDSEKITIIDSKSVSLGLGYQVLYAARAVKNGIHMKEILKSLEEVQDKERIYFVVNDMKYLAREGRIGKTKGLIGEILNLKTILRIENGEISFECSAISEASAINYLVRVVKHYNSKDGINVGVAWGGTEKEEKATEKLEERISEIEGICFTEKYGVGATIGAHTGPVYGVAITKKI